MSNITGVLKDEIRRLCVAILAIAKREVKLETSKTDRAIVQCRRDIAHLNRLLAEQAKKIASLQRHAEKPAAQPTEKAAEMLRFSARSVKAQRTRLGLSASNYGKLVGVSPLTIYAWEQGKSRPHKAKFAALVAVRGIGKREAATPGEAGS